MQLGLGASGVDDVIRQGPPVWECTWRGWEGGVPRRFAGRGSTEQPGTRKTDHLVGLLGCFSCTGDLLRKYSQEKLERDAGKLDRKRNKLRPSSSLILWARELGFTQVSHW